jgi:hypothetical protein
MTRRVVDHVFNGTETSADFGAVHETYEKSHTIKGMLKTAMMRYATRELKRGKPREEKPEAKPSSSSPPAVVAADGKIQVSPKLREMVNESCKECHKAGKDLDLTTPSYDRRLALGMLDQVGFAAMPKTAEGLDEPERRAFVAELARLLWSDPQERAVATAWYDDGVRGRPVHRFASAMNSVNARVGKGQKGFRPSAIELATPQPVITYSPAVAVSSAVTAVRSCHDAGHKDEALAACVERASAPGAVISGALVD